MESQTGGGAGEAASVVSVKVKGLDIYEPLLTGKPEQQWFTDRRVILTAIKSDVVVVGALFAGANIGSTADQTPPTCAILCRLQQLVC